MSYSKILKEYHEKGYFEGWWHNRWLVLGSKPEAVKDADKANK